MEECQAWMFIFSCVLALWCKFGLVFFQMCRYFTPSLCSQRGHILLGTDIGSRTEIKSSILSLIGFFSFVVDPQRIADQFDIFRERDPLHHVYSDDHIALEGLMTYMSNLD